MSLTKKIMIYASLFAVCTSCKKDKPKPDSFISYKVNGVYEKLSSEADYFSDGSFSIDAGKKGGEGIILYITSEIEEGAYQFGNDQDIALGEYIDPSGKTFLSDSGQLVINTLDENIVTGTFAFKASNGTTVKSITEGQFAAEIDDLPPSSDTSLMITKNRKNLIKLRFVNKTH